MDCNNVIKSLDTGQSRFSLCHQAFKVVRKMLNNPNRNQEISYDALQRLAGTERRPVLPSPESTDEAPIGATVETAAEPALNASEPG